jgi:hypothetical protein
MSSSETNETSEKSELTKTFELLETKSDYDQTLRKNLILFIGLTGTGKSTLAHFLASNPKLSSVKSRVDYYITDGNDKISEETTTSKTLFPELILDPESGNVMADCPGFSDTRSVSHDIAATIFTRDLLGKAEKVKIIIAASHHSVRKGVDRLAFPKLLEHAAEFITSIDKYKNSIALMITKVENTLEDDLLIIEEIGTFLIEMRNVLKKKPQNHLTDKKMQLLNIFLNQQDDMYSNIGIFLRPDREGPLDELENLMDGKIRNRQILFKQLQYTESNSDDFGLSVSNKSKITVLRMIQAISQNISKLLNDECNILQAAYDAKIGNVNTLDELQTTISNISQMISQIETGNQPDFQVTETIQWFNTSSIQENQSFGTNLLKQQENLEFLKPLQSASKSKKQSNDFTKYYQPLAKFKEVLALKKTSAADKMVKMIDGEIRDLVDDASKNLTATYESKIVATNALNELQQILEGSSIFINQMKQSDETKFRILDPIKWFEISFIQLPGDLHKNLLELKSGLDYVKKIYNADSARNNEEHFTSFYSRMARFEPAFVQINSKASVKMVTLTDENIEKLFNDTAQGLIQRYDSEVTDANEVDQLQQMLPQITIFIDHMKQSKPKIFRIADVIDWFRPSNIAVPKDFEKGLTEQEQYLKSIEDNSINTAKSIISHYHEVAKIDSAFIKIKTIITDKMTKIINQNIKHTFDTTSKIIIEKFKNEIEKSTNYPVLEKQLTDALALVSKFNDDLSYEYERSTTVASLMTELLKKIFTTVPHDQKEYLLTHSNDIHLLIAATNPNRIKFSENLENAKEYLANTSKWYTFINYCFEKLSKFYIQKDLTTFDVDTNKNFAEFKLFLDTNNISYDKNLTLDASKQKSFDNLIEKTLRKSTINCCNEPNKIEIKGNFVKLSDIQICEETCINNSSLYIFAYHTLFIDIDLMKEGMESSVYVIAPIWEVIGRRQFNLNGKNGEHYLNAGLERNGLAGNPGGHGGHFLGIGNVFINSGGLDISSNGGRGGDGQNGRNGIDGKDGKTPENPESSMFHAIGSTDTCTTLTKRYDINGMTINGDNNIFLKGIDGAIGTDGGNGGKAGAGGSKGDITIISINQPHQVKISEEVGEKGVDGVAGIGGKGGKNGGNVQANCFYDNGFLGLGLRYSVQYKNYRLIERGHAASGTNGISNHGEPILQRKAKESSESRQSLTQIYKTPNQYQNEFFNPTTFKNFPESTSSLQKLRKKRSILYDSMNRMKTSALNKSLLLKGFFKCINEHTNYIVSQLVPGVSTNNINLDHKQLAQGTSSNGSFVSKISPSVDAFNSLILLLDVIARKLTKAKPSSKNLDHQTDWLEAQGAALNIVEKCEARWIDLHRINMIDENDFDFLALQRSVLKKVLQLDEREGLGQVEMNALKLVDAYYLKSQK